MSPRRNNAPPEEPARERLLSAATRLFGDKGYGSVSVREICKAAGTSINMIHHYFGSKEALLDEVMARFDEGVYAVPFQLLKKPPASRDDVVARIEMIFEATLEAYVAHREVLAVAVREHRALPVALAFMTRFAEFLDEAKAKGFVREGIDSSMVSGAILDRLLNQVQFAPWIQAATGKDVVHDLDYRASWARANIDLFLNGFLA